MNKSYKSIKIESKITQAKKHIKNPVTAIRAKCIDCSPESNGVTNCVILFCSLHPYRFGKSPFRGKDKPNNYLPPLKSIRAECMSCNYTAKEVRLCPCGGCALHPYRFGKNPHVSQAKRKQSQKLASNLRNGT